MSMLPSIRSRISIHLGHSRSSCWGPALIPIRGFRATARFPPVFTRDFSKESGSTEAESTDDEARLAGSLVATDRQVALATSAGHMPRAMAIFAKAGFDPLAAPCDFSRPREGSSEDRLWKQWLPSEGGAGATQQMLYEAVALLWEKVKG